MEDILKQQIRYYRARAAEYDQWFYRNGRYDWGEALNRQWFDEAEIVRKALHEIGPVEQALELACGTGIWTLELAQMAGHVTALDASPEMIAINRAKVNSLQVSYHEVNLFTWEPDAAYDLVFFGFWLSHVPPDRLDGFLKKAQHALRPGGRMFFVDSLLEPTSSAHDHARPDAGELYQTRKLNDGQTFRVVKVFYEPGALENQLTALGLEARVTTTGTYFLYGIAHNSD
jgi:ubiquinone/menaquinone biosynthesis C-methylase UbiE